MTKWFAGALLVVALVCASVAAAADTQTIRLKKLALVFTLPSDWDGQAVALRFDAHAKDKNAALTIQGVTTKLTLAAIAKAFANSEKAQLAKTDPKATVVRQQTTLNGIQVVKVTLHFLGEWPGHPKVTPQTHFVWTYKRGPTAYILDYSTPDSSLTTEKPLIDASIRSLRFTGLTNIA